MDLAIARGRPADSVRATVAGVNHLPIVTQLTVDGDDGFAILEEMVAEAGGLEALADREGQAEAEPFSHLDFVRRHVLALTFLDRFGALPAAGDRHVAEFVPWALTESSAWGAAYNVELTPMSNRRAHQAGYIADVDAWVAGTKDLQTWASGELPALVIDSLVTGTPRELPVNIPNAGQVPDVPDDAVVESICVVDEKGIRGRDRAVLPAALAELVRRHVAVTELTLDAALSGDPGLASSAFLLDPLAGRGDLHRTEAMATELRVGTARWLPQFAA
jgi:alpha-galactosidase